MCILLLPHCTSVRVDADIAPFAACLVTLFEIGNVPAAFVATKLWREKETPTGAPRSGIQHTILSDIALIGMPVFLATTTARRVATVWIGQQSTILICTHSCCEAVRCASRYGRSHAILSGMAFRGMPVIEAGSTARLEATTDIGHQSTIFVCAHSRRFRATVTRRQRLTTASLRALWCMLPKLTRVATCWIAFV